MIRIYTYIFWLIWSEFQALSHAFNIQNSRRPHIWPLSLSPKYRQNVMNQQTVTDIESVLKVVRIRQHAKYQAIPLMRYPENARKRKFDLFHSIKLQPKYRKSTDRDQIESVPKVVRAHVDRDAKCQKLSAMRSPGNARKPHISPLSKCCLN